MKGSKTPTIIAVTALVVSVLAATPLGHAAGRLVLAKGSVGTAQLKNNAVTSVKVKNGSLLAADFKAGQVPSGPKGDPGPQGPRGDVGAPGATRVVQRIADGPIVGAGGWSRAGASCQSGETLVGGGAKAFFTWPADATLVMSAPISATMWWAEFRNDGTGSTMYARAYALCASP